MSKSSKEDFRHVYHLGPGRLLIFPLLWLVFSAILTLGLWDAKSRWAGLVCLGGLTLFFLVFQAIIWQSRLVLNAQGISHHQFGYTVRSSWENLHLLVMQVDTSHLILKERGSLSRLLGFSVGMLGAGTARGLIGDPQAFAEGRVIMIAPFMAHWRRGPLRADLQRWAPQLFDANGNPKRRA